PVWADNWQPPQAAAKEEVLPPVVSDVLAAESSLLAAGSVEPESIADGSYHVSMDDFLAALQPTSIAEVPSLSQEMLPEDTVTGERGDSIAAVDTVMTPTRPIEAAICVEESQAEWAQSSHEAGQDEGVIAAEPPVLLETADVVAWSEPAEVAPAMAAPMSPAAAVPDDAASLDVAAEVALPAHADVAVPAQGALPEGQAQGDVPLSEGVDSFAEDDGWPLETPSSEAEEVDVDAVAMQPPALVEAADWQPEAEALSDEDAPWSQTTASTLAAEPAANLAAQEEAEPLVLDDDLPVMAEPDVAAMPEPEAMSAHATTPVQSISLDSLPTGVLGGGLGLASAAGAAAAVAQLGAAAEHLPGGDAWPLREQLRHGADERDVEQDWARDLHAEAPRAVVEMALEPEAMVMRSRRHVVTDGSESMTAPASEVELPFTMAPAPEPVLDSNEEIRVESVTPPLAAGSVLGGVDEGALIEALYARVLPRMKVELTLWMQDALEQQAKSLISGVMQQMKEDFDMMLAQSLKESLREALDEVAPQRGKEN
ncbi:hypothetical protein, partial [Vogesella oryzae]|uniref:hypothetical protein n=1 Tax=Vogesella oryzae TaxID=1735285 RepID=UPI001C2E47E1